MSAAHDPVPARGSETLDADLGFGAVVARESRRRLLNPDGSFNVRRQGLRWLQSMSAYHYLLTITWTRFFGWVSAVYLAINAVFAFVFYACGPGALSNISQDPLRRLFDCFFFSVHTFATIGYGNIAPVTLLADVMVTIESLVSVIAGAIVTGLAFARFARPSAQILFSERAVIAPYRDGLAFMFRIANQRSTQLVDVEAKVLFTRRKKGSVTGEREFMPLRLERERVVFFPLSWTIVHPIDAASPLRGWTETELQQCDAEFLILLNGFDETFSQTVHVRSSYRGDEVVVGARFRSMFNPPDEDGILSIDIRRLHDYERV